MIRTGVFTIVNGECRLSDGTLLAVCTDPSPLVAARPFLLGRGCQPNHWIEVTGTAGTIGSVTVFCMTDARPIAAPAEMIRTATTMPVPTKSRTKKKKRAKEATKEKKPTPKKEKKRKKKTTIRRRNSR